MNRSYEDLKGSHPLPLAAIILELQEANEDTVLRLEKTKYWVYTQLLSKILDKKQG